MIVIPVFNQKGGVGKTTTCHNLSAVTARAGKSVIAIDLDPQSHLSLAFGIDLKDANQSAFAFFSEQKALHEVAITVEEKIKLIPAHIALSKIDTFYGKKANISGYLKAGLVFSFGKQPADTVVMVDCNPALGVLSLNALVASDKLIVPVSADFLSKESLPRLHNAIKVLEQRSGRAIDFRVVITRFNAQRKLSHDVMQIVKDRFQHRVCDTIIMESPALAQAPAVSKSIFKFDVNSRGAQDYQSLYDELESTGFFNP